MVFKKTLNVDSHGDMEATADVWNVAEGYVKMKILRPLILLDRYENIAKFGVEEIDLDFGLDQNTINKKRVDAITRYVFTLKQLINNVDFAIKKEDKKILKELIDRIEMVEQYLSGIYGVYKNHVTREEEIKINEKHFDICMGILWKIKRDLNSPLNHASLIFRESEDMDLEKIMQDIVEGG